jgi:hypothetical protein
MNESVCSSVCTRVGALGNTVCDFDDLPNPHGDSFHLSSCSRLVPGRSRDTVEGNGGPW